mgnify:FL=1
MSTYKELKGQSIRQVAQDPTNPQIGEIWYNTTIGVLKARKFTAAAWASGGNLNSARFSFAGCGTQTLGLAFGGNSPPPSGNIIGFTEEYNGSSWSEQNDLGTSRAQLGGCGTQTAGLAFGGRLEPPSTQKNETEEYH